MEPQSATPAAQATLQVTLLFVAVTIALSL
jgi:hypothetical protein